MVSIRRMAQNSKILQTRNLSVCSKVCASSGCRSHRPTRHPLQLSANCRLVRTFQCTGDGTTSRSRSRTAWLRLRHEPEEKEVMKQPNQSSKISSGEKERKQPCYSKHKFILTTSGLFLRSGHEQIQAQAQR